MNPIIIFIWIWLAMIAVSFWESYVEGRNAWDKGKSGWKINLPWLKLTAYHFWLFWVMFPMLLALPLIIYGWNYVLFKVLVSAYFSGLVIEDFFWYVVNPKVKFKELFTSFSDYYPWIRIKKRKIIPWLYVIGMAIAIGVLLI